MFQLKMGKMPNSETGLLLTSMAKQVTVLQFDEIDDASALPKYVNQSQNISRFVLPLIHSNLLQHLV